MSEAESYRIEICPGCGAHLEDTWSGDECGRCGFAYIVEDDSEQSTTTGSQIEPGPSLTAGILSIIFGSMAGAFLGDVSVGRPADAIGFAVETGPNSSPLLAVGFLTLALLTITFSSLNRSPATKSRRGSL